MSEYGTFCGAETWRATCGEKLNFVGAETQRATCGAKIFLPAQEQRGKPAPRAYKFPHIFSSLERNAVKIYNKN